MSPFATITAINMIRGTAAAAAKECPKGHIGIMATDGTIQTGLYQKALAEQGLTPFTPDKDIQKEVMHQIYDRIKNGQPYDAESWTKIEAAYKAAVKQAHLFSVRSMPVLFLNITYSCKKDAVFIQLYKNNVLHSFGYYKNFKLLQTSLSCNFCCEIVNLLLKTFAGFETNKLLNSQLCTVCLSNFCNILSNSLLAVFSLYVYLVN